MGPGDGGKLLLLLKLSDLVVLGTGNGLCDEAYAVTPAAVTARRAPAPTQNVLARVLSRRVPPSPLG